MRNFKERLYRFMYGRYGIDQFYYFLVISYFVIILINVFIGSAILSAISLLLFIYSTFRILSKNIYKRRAENEKFLKIKNKVSGFFSLTKKKFSERNTHVYKKCPNCKSTLRLRKEKGEHTVLCPKCSSRFNIKI